MMRVLLGVCVLAATVTSPADAEMAGASKAPVRGVVRPVRQASISTDLPARISRLPFREAEAFKTGDVLVVFDCERLRAEYAAASASAREVRLNLESQTYLEKRGAVGKLDVEIARARLDKAEAETSAIGARVKQCEIIAPFDGRITDLKINEHELPSAGVPFMSLVEEARFEIDLIAPSQMLRQMDKGTPFKFVIDETGRAYAAEVLRIGAAVDPVSQSIKLIARFIEADARVLSGMSGVAVWGDNQRSGTP